MVASAIRLITTVNRHRVAIVTIPRLDARPTGARWVRFMGAGAAIRLPRPVGLPSAARGGWPLARRRRRARAARAAAPGHPRLRRVHRPGLRGRASREHALPLPAAAAAV